MAILILLASYQDAHPAMNWNGGLKHAETMVKVFYDSYKVVTPTPLPYLSEDTRIRPAAYAYYRIVLLHIMQENESDATTTYNTLQQTFGKDQYGRPYVEMASAFWEAYQSTHKMYDGCAAAIQYAVEHPEILIPLGSDYHRAQSHIYVPDDVRFIVVVTSTMGRTRACMR
jgi:hypothetical protein